MANATQDENHRLPRQPPLRRSHGRIARRGVCAGRQRVSQDWMGGRSHLVASRLEI